MEKLSHRLIVLNIINIILLNSDVALLLRNKDEAFCVGDRTIFIKAVAFLLVDLLRRPRRSDFVDLYMILLFIKVEVRENWWLVGFRRSILNWLRNRRIYLVRG